MGRGGKQKGESGAGAQLKAFILDCTNPVVSVLILCVSRRSLTIVQQICAQYSGSIVGVSYEERGRL